jgi:hypothetical protein
VLRPLSLYRHAIATTPAGSSQGSSCFPDSDDCGLPQMSAGSAPASIFSRPARRSLTLWPACSRRRLAALSIEGFGSFVTSATAPIATGWSNNCQAGIAPTEERHLYTAHGHSGLFLLYRPGDATIAPCLEQREHRSAGIATTPSTAAMAGRGSSMTTRITMASCAYSARRVPGCLCDSSAIV